MSDITELAELWTSTTNVKEGERPDPQRLFFFNELCEEIADSTKMEPFFQEVPVKVASMLDELLRQATPLTAFKLRGAIDRAIMIYRNTESLGALNELAVFAPMIVYVSFSSPERIINGLSCHERFARTYDWMDVPKEYLVEALAVVKVTSCLDGTKAVVSNVNPDELVDPYEEKYLTIKDSKLVDLIASRHEQANGIIDIVKSRPTISADLVVEMLEYDQQALLNGVL